MGNILEDDSPMPWGKYKGKDMADVPAEYLMWCYENGKCCDSVKAYIEDNRDAIDEEIGMASRKGTTPFN